MSMIGRTLGHYSVSALLGKGGMGEVYKAKDQKLGRDVAIKVLPEEFAKDADRVARFQREAKLLASLNHPHIAAIYGLEESDGTHFLVLELIEGDTLADRLKHGAIPVEESLKLALQIAEALAAAHEKGIIHRDLKPANIKVTPDGKVKVLDFGLAKAFAGDSEDTNLSNSPTLSVAATQQGIILGTAAYMSPEQARGKTVDKRSDIWAFGVVLYEMLTGQSAFQGEDVSVTLASVIKGDANFALLPPSIHPRVREVITRCLQNDIRRRYSGIADARYEIEQALADPGGLFVQPAAKTKPRRRMRVGIPWVALALVLTAIIAGVAVWKLKPAEPRRIMSFDYHLPEGQQFTQSFYGDYSIAVSPDHSHFVYGTREGLYIRSLDQLDARPIPGTDGNSMFPFFSPDGQWIAYFSNEEDKLKKIAISGGAPVALCDVSAFYFAMWCTDNTIIYGTNDEAIMRVSADGGTPETLIEGEDGDSYVSPQMLPDEKAVLFNNWRGNTSTIYVQSLESGERKKLLEGEFPRYFSTGHIIYLLDNNLFAVPFDIDMQEVTGGSVSLVEGVGSYDISDTGTLMYIPGTIAPLTERTLVWVDREGKEKPLGVDPDNYQFVRISPDGTRVALTIRDEDSNNEDIHIWDVARKNMMTLTFDEAVDSFPLWTPDSKRIIFTSTRNDSRGLYIKNADGTGEVELLTDQGSPVSWADNGRTLAINAGGNIGVLSMEGDRTVELLLQEKHSASLPMISPDGRWMAYMSNESGQLEVYVRPFPDVDGGKWKISTNGGYSQGWSPDGRELYYWTLDALMVAAVESEPTFNAGTPEVLLQRRPAWSWPMGSFGIVWGIHPDGKRFLMIKRLVDTEDDSTQGISRKFNIVLNWFEELKERVPVD